MEELLVGFFEGTLKKYIIDFSREQLNLSFLKGQGGMENLSVNCEEINQILEGYPVSFNTKMEISTYIFYLDAPFFYFVISKKKR